MRRSHSGQASILLIALLGSMVACFAVAFSAGQLVNDKMRLVMADAAAYSAATWEARSLNFQSYMNRDRRQRSSRRSAGSCGHGRATWRRSPAIARVAQFIPPLSGPIRHWPRVGVLSIRHCRRHCPQWRPASTAGTSQCSPTPNPSRTSSSHRGGRPGRRSGTPQRAARPGHECHEAAEARNAAQWQNRFTEQEYRRGGGDLRRFSSLLMDSRRLHPIPPRRPAGAAAPGRYHQARRH